MNKQQLTIEHLAPYLPYGVKVVDDEYKDIHTLFTVCSNNSIVVKNNEDKGDDVLIYGDFKLLLRPLSDLTKEIEHNGKQFVPVEMFARSKRKDIEYIIFELKDLLILEHYIFQLLIEWHFDVFSLIEKGLAINLNEVK